MKYAVSYAYLGPGDSPRRALIIVDAEGEAAATKAAAERLKALKEVRIKSIKPW
ncbi:MAG: hypothetical protein [Microvirus sp.]|nr:MAG: hypothetical protein [Microvirus sp.]